MIDGGYDGLVEFDPTGKLLGSLGSPGHQPGQFAWGHFLAFTADHKIVIADVLNWRFQVFAPATPSGRRSDYVPTTRRYFGFKQSDGYDYRAPGWPARWRAPRRRSSHWPSA